MISPIDRWSAASSFHLRSRKQARDFTAPSTPEEPASWTTSCTSRPDLAGMTATAPHESTKKDGTRESRQRKCASDDGLDINNGKAVSGRVAFSPMLGVEVAGSGYYGNASPNGNYNPLSIMALDWTLQRGPFELIGEAAWAYARGNSRAIQGNTIGFAPGSLLTGIGGKQWNRHSPAANGGLLHSR